MIRNCLFIIDLVYFFPSLCARSQIIIAREISKFPVEGVRGGGKGKGEEGKDGFGRQIRGGEETGEEVRGDTGSGKRKRVQGRGTGRRKGERKTGEGKGGTG